MKIQYASDLHLELTHNAKYINTLPIEAVGDVLVLAGDIFNLCDKTPPCPKFWELASTSFREVLIVAGNHEYYHDYDILTNGDSWSREILPNIHSHANAEAVIGGTRITSNQLGYVHYREHLNGFDGAKTIAL